MIQNIEKEEFLDALKLLDVYLDRPLKLLVAGGGALLLAHHLSIATSDIDAVPFQSDWSLGELDKIIKKIAKEKNLNPDWLNPYFVAFS